MLQDTAARAPDDVAVVVKAAKLVYCSDGQPGIRRMRSGKGFRYCVDVNGSARSKAIRDKSIIARINALAIPPAWKDVWISPDEDSHIQATGRDQRGRKQYRYHARWTECRDDVKYSSLAEFATKLPRLRRRVTSDMKRKDLSRERVLASVVYLLDRAMIRVGNETYARDNKSFGLTTLRTRHVKVRGSVLRFAFKGKSGKDWNLEIEDRRVARVIKDIQDLPGQQLFQYVDDDGTQRSITSQDVNDYIRSVIGQGFTSKHFRTWGGSVAAAEVFAQTQLPETLTAQRKLMNATIDRVAGKLGNTRAICRKCYIHPQIIRDWQDGRLATDMEAARKNLRAPRGLQISEALFQAWLKKAMRRKK